jgi:hypothetical protein
MRKFSWCDRAAILSPYFCLCLDEKTFHKEIARFGGLEKKNYPSFVNENASATTHIWINNEKNRVATIVCLNKWETRGGIQIASLLVHEACHIYQEMINLMGERNAGDEIMAYSIQHISQELMYSFKEQTCQLN